MKKKVSQLNKKKISDMIISDAIVLKAMGHPVRLKLLIAIYLKNCIVSGLVECVQEPQPIVSQQLSVLKKHDIIEGEKHGNKILYKIIHPMVSHIIKKYAEKIENAQ